MDYTKYTLGELLTHTNDTIKRNAMSILKTLQKQRIQCNNCMKTYTDDTQLMSIDDMNACPYCKTDKYLMDL